jgi:RHS repeat-associated protein
VRALRSLSVTVLAVMASLLSIAAAAPPASYRYTGPIWSPSSLPATPSVHGRPLVLKRQGPVRLTEPGVPAVAFHPRTATWPAAGTGTARLTRLGSRTSAESVVAQAGGLPVWVGTVASRPGAHAVPATPAGVRVQLASRTQALGAGINGVVMTLAQADGGSSAAAVQVRLRYGGFADAYGGGWASRLRLVALPACALTTPRRAACRVARPLSSVNDGAAQTVSATVTLSPAAVLAAISGPSGATGDYTATSLNPDGTWAVQDGDFTYSYKVTAPPAPGGTAPDVTLRYDSQSIDGETSGRNTQASWIGDGWSYDAGFIERSYKSCSKDGLTGSADECWGGYNATMSLDGHSGVLAQDSSGNWHLQGDDGTKIQLIDGASNGLWNGEYWLATTTDGTQYYFGLNHLPGGSGSDTATNSAWGVPVYNPNAGSSTTPADPCYSPSSGAASECQMGWRWNLDYVVDPHGNLQTYDYTAETNYYNRGAGQNSGNGTLTEYDRGGYLDSISYGYRLPDAVGGGSPAEQVDFGTAQRCVTSSSYTCGTAGPTTATAANWPDVPFDQNCGSTGTCTAYAPTFWSTMRLDTITTKVGSATVDSYQFVQAYPNASGASQPVMFLDKITHTGEDGGSLALPSVTFTPTETDNRVDGLVPAAEALYRPRISDIATESGGSIAIQYATPACSRVNGTMPSSADTNTMPCFPVWWTPAGESSPIQDWFNKSLISEVAEADNTGINSPAQVTSYQYVGGAAWHQDMSPETAAAYRTWDQFRGYAKVITEAGASPDPVTETETTYLRGMNGDATASGGTTSVAVTDSLGDSITDDNWLAGQVLETDTYTKAGGTVDAKTVNGPWTYSQTASQSQPSGLPALTAHMLATAQTRQLSLLASGSWRTEQTDTTYNTAGQVVTSDHKGDGSASDPEVCTTTSYATSTANPMMESYADEVKAVAGACGTAATAANTVSDSRTYYDGAGKLSSLGTFGTIPGAGNVTGTDAIDGYDSSGKPTYQPKSAATYDAYGRTLTATDANGNVTTTAYTPATGALPTQSTVTNAKGWTTTTLLDQARQLPEQVTDANGRITSQAYDALGRLTAVWLPDRSKSGGQTASMTYSYALNGTSPPVVTTSTLRENGSYAQDITIYDGLLQVRQEQASTADGSAGRLVTDTFHDSHGWVVKTSAAYYDSTTSPDSTVDSVADDQVPSQTVTQYDGQGRVIASQFYSLAVLQWQTTTAYPGADETDVTPPAGGTATSTFTNGRGETTATWSYLTATPDGKAADADVTSFSYTPSGQTATISDNSGDKWTYTYNVLGQKISQADPDAGTTTYGYDANGNMTSTTDARGQTITYTYDPLNRKTAEYNGTTELDSWTYDTLAKGKLTSSTAYYNGNAYTEAITGYGTDYQPTGTSVTIPSAEGSLAGTYTTTDTYTPNIGLLNSTQYSADGGLPSEQVSYSYDLAGLLNAFGGSTAYLDKTSYTPFGQVQRTTTGLYGDQLVLTASYDQDTQRLLQTTTNLQTLTAAEDTVNYTYNDAGAITAISDAQDGGQTDLQCFQYDNLNRLTQAWTDTGTTTTAGGTSVPGIGGCTDTSPSQSAVGGPAPYWQTYTYDLLGDRKTAVSHQSAGNTTQTLSYSGSQPNAVSTVTTTGPSGTTTAGYTYDAAGNTKTRTGASALTLSYYPQGTTSSVTTSSGTSNYLYDAAGNLLIQRDPTSTTLYLDGGAEQLVLSGGTVTGSRFYTEPDGTTIVRSSSAAISYTVANQQGTSLESVSASTLAVTRRYFDPYGAARGAAASSWPDNLGYVGRPADAATALDLLGARQYDPLTGRFLQVDPVLEAGDSRQMGGYSYAADDPVDVADPNGTMPDRPTDGGSGPTDTGNNAGNCWGPGSEWLCGAPPPPPPPTCPSGQHLTANGCADNTITVTAPNGDTATHDANQSTCATSLKGCESDYNLFKSFGYNGSRNITYQDLWNWAQRAKIGWVNLCYAFFGQGNFDDCGTDPFSGQTNLWKPPKMDWWKAAQTTAGVAALFGCTYFSAGTCLYIVGGGVGVDIGSGVAHGEPAGNIVKSVALTIIVTVVARGVDGGLDFEPSPAEIAAAKGTAFEDPESYSFLSGAQGASVRAVTAFPEDVFVAVQIYRAGGASADEVEGGGN